MAKIRIFFQIRLKSGSSPTLDGASYVHWPKLRPSGCGLGHLWYLPDYVVKPRLEESTDLGSGFSVYAGEPPLLVSKLRRMDAANMIPAAKEAAGKLTY